MKERKQNFHFLSQISAPSSVWHQRLPSFQSKSLEAALDFPPSFPHSVYWQSATPTAKSEPQRFHLPFLLPSACKLPSLNSFDSFPFFTSSLHSSFSMQSVILSSFKDQSDLHLSRSIPLLASLALRLGAIYQSREGPSLAPYTRPQPPCPSHWHGRTKSSIAAK